MNLTEFKERISELEKQEESVKLEFETKRKQITLYRLKVEEEWRSFLEQAFPPDEIYGKNRMEWVGNFLIGRTAIEFGNGLDRNDLYGMSNTQITRDENKWRLKINFIAPRTEMELKAEYKEVKHAELMLEEFKNNTITEFYDSIVEDKTKKLKQKRECLDEITINESNLKKKSYKVTILIEEVEKE